MVAFCASVVIAPIWVASIQRIADDGFCEFGGDHLLEVFGRHRALDDQPRAGDAALAGVEGDPEGDAVSRVLEVCVGEDDLRVFAAEFEPELLEIAGRRVARNCRPTAVEPVNDTMSTSIVL
jgi:hypothetical protein